MHLPGFAAWRLGVKRIRCPVLYFRRSSCENAAFISISLHSEPNRRCPLVPDCQPRREVHRGGSGGTKCREKSSGSA